ncbi:hypothetical protein RWE15_12290 [Virgibacillus halophilus]|uniref:CO dehydrogenase flavoprotein C-terminal domain-containing protein n=2 Tax=Tigheibacillus halophilus TaxID=361280 RepID=A0ABU5C6V8_9BACI|nr:hypothetical protein [Virgibacillus halophilus]
MDRIGYPLVTVSALKAGNWLRVAFSGVCGFPFRHTGLEVALNDQRQSVKQRIATAVNQLPAPVLDDLEGSASYRLFVLRNVLEETLIELEGNERHGTISRIDD